MIRRYMALGRTYVADLPGGTATTTIQMTKKGSFKTAFLSLVCAAAGSVELSRSSAPQIGTAQPTADVLARWRVGAAGRIDSQLDFESPQNVNVLDNLYVHQTGAANVGELVLG